MNRQRNISSATTYRGGVKNISLDNQFTLSKKQLRNVNLFCLGFLIFNIGYVLTVIAIKEINADTSQGIQLAGIVLLIFGAVNLMHFKFDNKYLKIVFTIYIIYVLTIIARVGNIDYPTFKTILFHDDYSILLYLLPLVILFPRNFGFYKRIFALFTPVGIVFIILCYQWSKDLLDPTRENNSPGQYVIECLFLYLAYPLTFILITYSFHKRKVNLFAILVTVLSVYFLIYRARRGSLFMCLTTLFGVLLVYLIYAKMKLMVIFLSVFLTLFFYIFLSGVKLPSVFDFLMTRKDEDTRGPVEYAMKLDMKTADWAIGKGINGTYYCPGINPFSDRRNIIETGYLQIILQGGMVSLILLGLIVVPAVYLGLFKSSNIFSKAAAIFILLWIIYQYPRIVNSFSIYYLLIWISVGICYSAKIRNLSDKTIRKHLIN